ncbi:tRNA-(ms[2]io[6]A)-hydroxylase [Acinetobacter schindleri]|jgi:tRNA 2-(methylsulfanyl)-N6-isopentenyladenosine37 hydroxylase|uniref:tRNA-(ms[2]io[6]A)-hydroxylase n=1 Tax=Acinetobacter TaxID=469 RepID=UPI000263E3B1|nr:MULTISPECIES: tRNA-(ms[2]io[6]A)-hydroxylase [Acinetobacter]APX63286.1 tRNA-hydroxylase protein MiaE [Acinetobacter schindleri]EIM38023.1 putative tRNA hydroxylase [Acinetobacter sp. HA]KMU98853.1 tRNA hydroxylase [Acinetobacter sp. VT 511]MBB4835498.1 tRNA-(ms[2]io[6]A)-hydroxylase [Acinetobacter schindleri]OIJ38417.1 tRNA-(ms[2]io[6]A)-hydroxylase [Acinetobacter sp. LCT-H3]
MSNIDYDELMKPVIGFLGCETPKAWLDEALQNLEILMQDHANCEKKAASTAMNLMFRYSFFVDLQVKLAQLVREEMLHYEQVLEFMNKRGQQWTGLSAGRYAGGLRKEIRTYEPESLIDVLVIGAFVEARSCERFYALAPHVDEELGRYYRYLLKSESRHFEDYLALAMDVAKTAKLKNPKEDIQARIEHIREVEKNLILSPDEMFRFHSGVPVKAA